MKNKKSSGITLVALVITIIVLLLLAGVTINLTIGNTKLLGRTEQSTQEYLKQEAKEIINLKITNLHMKTYAIKNRLSNLQELADELCEDTEIEYVVTKEEKTASLTKIIVGDSKSIFTKLKKYPYEFEIDSELQLASIDGVKIAQDNINDKVSVSKEEYEALLNRISELENNKNKGGSATIPAIGAWGYSSQQINLDQPLENTNYNVIITCTSPQAEKWGFVQYAVTNKTVNGFTISAYNACEIKSGTLTIDWTVVRY